MTRIALVTHADEPYLHTSDAHLMTPLQRRGATVDVVPWDADTAWTQYDAVVIRSAWDYTWRLDDFMTWIDTCAAMDVRLLNPAALVYWNLDKQYLQAIADSGVATVPTVYLPAEQASGAAIERILHRRDWAQAVVKPAISAGGDHTWRTTPATAAVDYASQRDSLPPHTLMIQPFMPQIATGEWSFVFLNGVYSHAVRKTPPEGALFVHEERGGTSQAATPAADTIAQASHALHHAERLAGVTSLYARVDGLLVHDALMLMEIEFIEPELFFQYAPPAAAERFADALFRQMRNADHARR